MSDSAIAARIACCAGMPAAEAAQGALLVHAGVVAPAADLARQHCVDAVVVVVVAWPETPVLVLP